MCHEWLGVWGAREVSKRLIITNTAVNTAALRTPRNANKATTKQRKQRPHLLWFKRFSAHCPRAEQCYKENQFFSVRGFSMCIHTEESLSIEHMTQGNKDSLMIWLDFTIQFALQLLYNFFAFRVLLLKAPVYLF